MRNLIFNFWSAAQLPNELFDSVEAQRNSAIAERHFPTKLKCNLNSTIKVFQHKPNTAFFAS